MSTLASLTTTVVHGRIEVDAPFDWPECTPVAVHALAPAITNDDAMTPEEITHVLAVMDQTQPLAMTEAELTAWETQRADRKEWEKSQFMNEAKRLQGMWE